MCLWFLWILRLGSLMIENDGNLLVRWILMVMFGVWLEVGV